MKSFPFFKQLDQMDCGPTCLRMIAQHYGKHYTAQTLRERAQISREGVSMLGISEAAESIGLHSLGVRIPIKVLIEQVPLPCVLHWGQNHFVVLHKVSKKLPRSGSSWPNLMRRHRNDESPRSGRPSGEGSNLNDEKIIFHVADPAQGLMKYTFQEFEKRWLGENELGKEGLAMVVEPTQAFFADEGEKANGLQLSQLVSYLWKYKKLLVQLGLGMLVGSALMVLMPILAQSVVDVGINGQNLPFIYLVLVAQMTLVCGTASVDFLRSWILLHISTRINLAILSEFLAKLMNLPISFFEVKQFGDIMQRIGDHHRIEAFLTGQTLNILFSFVNLLVFGVLLAFYHVSIFSVAIISAVIYSLWIAAFLGKRRTIDSQRFDVQSKNQSQIIQLIQGMQDIKLSGAEISKRWDWENVQTTVFKWNVRSLSLSQIQQAGALFINQGKNVLVTFLAAKAVLDGQLTIGGMMSIQYILGQFNSPIEQLIGFIQALQDARMSLERLNEVHSLPDEENASLPGRTVWEIAQDINFENITFAYPGAGNEPVLKDITLKIPYGKTTAIVGTSGSGKTTLLKLLLRFYQPNEGAIVLSNQGKFTSSSEREVLSNHVGFDRMALDLKNISHRAWRRQCGVVMQDGFIFSDTIAKNIAVADEVVDMTKLRQAAMLANIHEFIESQPQGYFTIIGAAGKGLSQGQRQRILIARSVYKDPSLLLFDEATNSLDANNEAMIVRKLEEFFKGRTVVVVAHRLSTVKHADQIIVLEGGQVVETGTHSELVARQGKYFELVSNQLELAV
ncbi:peptidase domain-containing ABC transporter [Dyadobacter sp. 676]|uniref:Peptidase domain-containing ABC transporter n=1 Tax=Dyadobacter sp. 676 TaxID=3088362 RepID=A0AAU8FJR5_9BACT